MSKTFPQESSQAFLNLKKSALRREIFWHSRSFPSLLNKPVGFITKLLKKQFKDSPLQSTPNLSLQRLRAAVSLVHAHCYWIQYNF